ncbi:MAG TPA: hypothetical protein VNX25_08000 [Verrucomicrobiae bacterium]|nr:hypothetical protein [Verrucomicrobiae bacterium]
MDVSSLWSSEEPALVRRIAVTSGVAAYMVGGAVRDRILRRPVQDYDFALEGDPEKLPREYARLSGGTFFWLDRDPGQSRVASRRSGSTCDFALLRSATIEGDLELRDFTANAVAASLSGRIIDPLNGIPDILSGVIRACSPRTFDDDPLRLLRAWRLSAQLSFRIEEATRLLLRERAPLLERVAAERIREEIFKILLCPGWEQTLRRLQEDGLLRAAIGEQAGEVIPVDRAVQEAGEGAPPAAVFLRARLSRELEHGVTHLALLRLRAALGGGALRAGERLKLGNRGLKFLAALEAVDSIDLAAAARTSRSRHRFFADTEPAGPEILLLRLASTPSDAACILDLLQWGLQEYPKENDPLLPAGEVMKLLGLAPGPSVGEAMEAVRQGERGGLVVTQEDARRYLLARRAQFGVDIAGEFE